LKSIGKTCAATGKELQPGEECRSALVERNGRFVRLDFSEEGWDGPPADAIANWRSRVPVESASGRESRVLDRDSLLNYFEQLSEDGNPAQEKLRFVIALLLVQKRRMKIDGNRSDGDIEYVQLSGSHGEGPYEVREFDLSDEEREQLQQSVDAFLTGE